MNIISFDEITGEWNGSIDNPLLSIMCITYNHEKYIEDCLNGFLIQKTNFPFEILIYDDASTDSTQSLLKHYSDKYPGLFRLVFQNENQYSRGVRGITFRYLYPKVKGKYFAMCEGDDYWTDPLKLQTQVDFLEAHPEYSGCAHNTQVSYEDKSQDDYVLVKPQKKDVFTISDFASVLIYFHTSSYVTRKFPFEVFPEKYMNEFFGDWMLSMIRAEMGPVKYIDKIMSVYRIHEGGVWSRMSVAEQKHTNLKLVLQFNELFEKKYEDDFLAAFSKRLAYYINTEKQFPEVSIFDKVDIDVRYKSIFFCARLASERADLITAKDNSIIEKSKQIEDKNKQIEDKNKQIGDKNKQIEDNNKQIEIRNKTINENIETISDKDRLIQEKNRNIANNEKLIRDQSNFISEQKKQLQQLDSRIRKIESSIGWKTVLYLKKWHSRLIKFDKKTGRIEIIFLILSLGLASLLFFMHYFPHDLPIYLVIKIFIIVLLSPVLFVLIIKTFYRMSLLAKVICKILILHKKKLKRKSGR